MRVGSATDLSPARVVEASQIVRTVAERLLFRLTATAEVGLALHRELVAVGIAYHEVAAYPIRPVVRSRYCSVCHLVLLPALERRLALESLVIAL